MNTFGEATLGELAQALRGDLIRPDDPGYDEARSIWNGAHDRRPALILRCQGVADVLKGVEFARSEGLPLAVRGGGHSIPGFSTVDGGLVLDLSPMNGIRVDPGRGTVVAQGGCLWRDVDAETQAFGLAVTGGIISSTGIGGFTLGGGIGWLVRKCGLTCDNLIAADIVTADGQYLHTSEQERPELLWSLRGGGGNFGVVTSLELRLHEVGPTIFGGLVFYPGEHAEQILHGFRAATANAPDDLTALINMTTAPPAPFLPEEVHGKPIVAVGAMWAGRPEDGDAATRSLRGLAPVVTDLFGPMPYAAQQALLDPLYPRGMWNYFRSAFFDDLDDAAGRIVEEFHRIPNPITEIHIHHLGGAMGRVPGDATAFGTRDREFILNVVARSADADSFPPAVAWARGATDALGADAATYVNFTGEGTEERVRAAYPKTTYERLVTVKDEYDPTNLFRLNQNIAPSKAI
ncbi:FAD-binding oxidoreductase [Actinoplanes subtropicus]|uniref:FAD-binding oxidoreductase n=1 Tax=Actinoplanes subtropicus TaxID=543632 RepID=UPI0004C3733A|nr:FAD-binding oxidoreductase [Actinoplanes subtropicus]